MDMQNFGYWKTDTLNMKNATMLLPEFSVIEVKGDDAVSFVHGQVTNHINNLGNAFRLAAYCQPKGRILSLMRIFKRNDALYLIMPKDLVPGFIKRFSMFILRSKVSLRIADELSVFGVIAPSFELPEVDQCLYKEQLTIARVADAKELQRCMIIGEAKEVEALIQPTSSSAQWFATDILAGLPWVCEATKEAFIPQWINLDLIGGVVFNKGCYPGQEVIARVQHIGSTPRRMKVICAKTSVTTAPNDDITQDNSPVGNIVMAVSTNSETLALAEITNVSAEVGQFIVNGTEFVLA